MANTIIDRSETVSGLNLGAGSVTVIEKDALSPPGPVDVHVNGLNVGVGGILVVQQNATLDVNGINVGALSTTLVRDGGVLNITGVAQAGVLSKIDIGHDGTVKLGNSLSVNVLSSINFIGPFATLDMAPAAQGPLLSPASSGVIAGFGATDTIDMQGLAGVTHAQWTQTLVQKLIGNGTVKLFNAQNVKVGAINLHGSYTTANFAVSGDGHNGTDITFVPHP